MDIVVKGRNVEVPEHYRQHVEEKLARIERYDSKAIRYDIELFHEPNPRQAKVCQRVEITGKGRGPVVRAEACAQDFYAALDVAVAKLENHLRRSADRRKVHHGRRQPTSVAEATAGLAEAQLAEQSVAILERGDHVPEPRSDDAEWDDAGPGRIVREKEHPSEPMTSDQALSAMELVGHDFYLFSDIETGKPSVVYRRHGFDYGVIRLA